MSLEANTNSLQRTEAAKRLDPSEKGAVSYFLGMTMCKLFATALLDAPWLIHLDSFAHTNAKARQALKSRSRPDLIGQAESTGDWIVFESKGRVSTPDHEVKAKAKTQASEITSIDGTSPSLHIAGIMYFRNDLLRYYWADPPPSQDGESFDIRVTPDVWRYHYEPVLGLMKAYGSLRHATYAEIPDADASVEIHPTVYKLLKAEQWADAKAVCSDLADEFEKDGWRPDGLQVTAGASWLDSYE